MGGVAKALGQAQQRHQRPVEGQRAVEIVGADEEVREHVGGLLTQNVSTPVAEGDTSGSSRLKVAPSPGRLRTSMLPPSRPTTRL